MHTRFPALLIGTLAALLLTGCANAAPDTTPSSLSPTSSADPADPAAFDTAAAKKHWHWHCTDTGDTVRGKDLTEVFLFDQTQLPAIAFQ